MAKTEVRLGVYRHFKGGFYYVIGVGTHTETGEQFVVYRKAFEPTAKIWIRPLDMFTEMANGKPRFEGVRA